MASRLHLQYILEDILGSSNVYFQPPASVRMKYPAIVYSRSDIDNTHANNSVYKQDDAYEVTVIDPDPEGTIARKVSILTKCSFNRQYIADNLYHDVFTIYI